MTLILKDDPTNAAPISYLSTPLVTAPSVTFPLGLALSCTKDAKSSSAPSTTALVAFCPIGLPVTSTKASIILSLTSSITLSTSLPLVSTGSSTLTGIFPALNLRSLILSTPQ